MSQSPWIKIVVFIVIATMLAGIAEFLLDPGLGRADDESRRVFNVAGFSVINPRGWDASVTVPGADEATPLIHLNPSRSVGRASSIIVRQLPLGPLSMPNGVPLTFQGQPARGFARQGRDMWSWRLAFDRSGTAYEITLSTKVPQDIEHGPLRAFIDSFRVDRPPTTTRAAE